MEPNKTKPQIMPAVSSVVVVTAALATAQLAEELGDPATARALTAALARREGELDWRYNYAHDRQLESVADWRGRQPGPGDEENFMRMLVVDDQIAPALAREVDAQFAKDPEWDAVLNDAKLDNKHEVVQALTEWHAEAGLTGTAKEVALTRLWAGRAVGRVYIPDEYAERLATRPPTTLAEVLELIHVQAVDPREGGPIEDGHRRVLGYWYRYQDDQDGETRSIVEVHTPARVLTYLESNEGLRLLGEADNPHHDPQQPQRLRRAEYLMWHLDRDGGSALTRSVRDAQDRLNVVQTYKGRNDDQTGYRQFITSNAEQPKDRQGNPVPFPMGPGIALNIIGMPIDAIKHSADSRPQRHVPGWEVVDPLDPEQFHHPSAAGWTRSLLNKLDQGWVLDAALNTSAVSKRESRKPFERRVAFAAQDVALFIAWALRAALMLAGQVLGRTAEFSGVTFQPKMYVDVDAVNLEELRVKLQMWQAGALTLTSLLEVTPGVSDAAKEVKALEEGGAALPVSEEQRRQLQDLVGGNA